MSNIKILKLLGLSASMGTLVSLYVLYWGVDSGVQKFFCFAVPAFLVGFLISFPVVGYSAKTESGSISKVGTALVIGFLALILSAFGVGAFINNHYFASAALDIFAVVLIIFSIGTSFISSQHVDAITASKNYSSDHMIWAADLNEIANICAEKDLKIKIKGVADNMVYLARDSSSDKLTINLKITEVIKTISINVTSVNRVDVELNLNELSSLIVQREMMLKQGRNQV